MLGTARPLQPDTKPPVLPAGLGRLAEPTRPARGCWSLARHRQRRPKEPQHGGRGRRRRGRVPGEQGLHTGTASGAAPGRAPPHPGTDTAATPPAQRCPPRSRSPAAAPTCAARPAPLHPGGAAGRTWLGRAAARPDPTRPRPGPAAAAAQARPVLPRGAQARPAQPRTARVPGQRCSVRRKASCAPVRARAQLPSRQGQHFPHTLSLRLHPRPTPLANAGKTQLPHHGVTSRNSKGFVLGQVNFSPRCREGLVATTVYTLQECVHISYH